MNLMLAEREATRRERLTPLGRLEALCDPGSLELVRTRIESRSARSAPGDGVVGGAGTVGGRPVYCYAQDQGFAGGSLGTKTSKLPTPVTTSPSATTGEPNTTALG